MCVIEHPLPAFGGTPPRLRRRGEISPSLRSNGGAPAKRGRGCLPRVKNLGW
jgi:hypothetical protein